MKRKKGPSLTEWFQLHLWTFNREKEDSFRQSAMQDRVMGDGHIIKVDRDWGNPIQRIHRIDYLHSIQPASPGRWHWYKHLGTITDPWLPSINNSSVSICGHWVPTRVKTWTQSGRKWGWPLSPPRQRKNKPRGFNLSVESTWNMWKRGCVFHVAARNPG